MFRELREGIGGFLRSAGLMFRYLIVTSILQATVLFPLFWWAAKYLFAMRGLVSLNNANASRFLLSTPGALFILLALTMVLLTTLLEVGGFVKLSAIAIGSDTKPSYLTVIGSILRSLFKIAGPGLVLLLPFALVVLPLTGSALNPSFFTKFRIPNFITAAIFANPLYAVAYWCLVALMYVAALMIVFVFHFMLLGDLKTLAAIRASIRLMKPNVLRFAAFMFLAILFFAIFAALIIGAVAGLHLLSMMAVPEDATALATFVGSVFVILLALVVGLMASFVVPLELYLLTNRYYAFLRKLPDSDPLRPLADVVPTMPSKKRPSLLDRALGHRVALSFLVAAFVVGIAGLFTITADELTAAPDIAVVGHRGGPEDTAVENSMEAVEQSITAGAGYVEMDIQRTRDGQYVVFHDENFSRFTHERRAVHEMTLAEIRELDLGEKSNGRFSNVRVPTLEELLERTRGRIGIFLELKGRSADQQMVDDAVAAVKRHDMLDRVVVISLKYELITGIEERHPEVTSGFIYFLSFGDTAHLVGDYLILEEDAATSDTITQIHEAGKRAAVWTVNTEESMQKFVNWPVDAVITDRVRQWQAVAAERRRAAPLDVLMSELIE
ncbi:glycerophosphodiester phosphodiesterase family protein [Arachnia propionica]|uniref:glycerophosphodiester phosphodiesterase family protein n=1 Tax=Arachnia propionica TaxID=1750 RepID=UPI00242CC954|nr:glycerophosphodiester phosphodiesterase family protein [Arachnia propionica]